MNNNISSCPACGGTMTITEYSCKRCRLQIRGSFERCALCALPQEMLTFVRVFLDCEGSIKQVEKSLGISYPTVKARLAKLRELLNLKRFSDFVKPPERLTLLNEFKQGKISLDDVLNQL